jgi:hypothetical protein
VSTELILCDGLMLFGEVICYTAARLTTSLAFVVFYWVLVGWPADMAIAGGYDMASGSIGTWPITSH